MGAILILLTPIALVDSTSIIPTCIVPIIVLLGGRRPIPATLSFISGIFLAYFAFGLVIVFGATTLLETATEWLKSQMRPPNTIEVLIQIAIGVVLAALAVKLADRKQRSRDKEPPADVSAWGAFLFGAVFMLSGVWGALPYFAAIDGILRADLSATGGLLALGYYNLFVVVPLIAMVVIRAALGERSNALFERLNQFFTRWTKRLVLGGLLMLGFFLIADGVGWLIGKPIVPMPPF
jgi:cytochrome c biogenesis protein CcdA